MSDQLPEDGPQAAPTPQGTPPPQVDFPPVRNGIDYLTSVVEHLSAPSPDPQDLKYAVLHLHAATEVLLKARLQIAHWSLVFVEPLTATREKLESGDFVSCGVEETISRLERLASVDIEHKHQQAINALTLDRNRLQHYGLTHNAYAVEARAAKVLHFLTDFIHRHLLWNLDQTEREHAELALDLIRRDLSRIKRFVSMRMNDIKGQLNSCPEYTLQCTDCDQWTAIVMDMGGVRCLFCNTERDDAIAAAIWYTAKAGDRFITGPSARLAECPTCEIEAFRGRSSSPMPRTSHGISASAASSPQRHPSARAAPAPSPPTTTRASAALAGHRHRPCPLRGTARAPQPIPSNPLRDPVPDPARPFPADHLADQMKMAVRWSPAR